MSHVAVKQRAGARRLGLPRTRGVAVLCLIGMLAAVAASAQAASAKNLGAASKGKVVIASYGGSFAAAQTKAFFNPFTKVTGIKVQQTSNSGYPVAQSQESAHNIEWDVTSSDGASFASETAHHLLQKLDFKQINTKGINPAFVTPYGVGYIEYSQVMAWNKDKFGTAQLTPADFFDVQKYPGLRVLSADPSQTLEFALVASGVPPNKLYPLDINRAFTELDKLKGNVVFKDVTGQAALISQGDAAMAYIANGRIATDIQQGANWAYAWNGAVSVTEHWAVLKGAHNSANAMKFINFAIQARQQANLANIIPYGPTNVNALKFLKPALVATLPSYPPNQKQSVIFNPAWWGANAAKVQTQWNAFTAG